RGRLTSVKDAQGRETRYEYNAAGDLTAVITPDVACAVRADGGATGQTGGAGIHTGAKSSSLSLRPPGTAAGAYQRRRQYGVERGI
ncbi:RHS repeat protein, partial [Escherichia coli]|nr:RHS repeat protein [Escherichia coli]